VLSEEYYWDWFQKLEQDANFCHFAVVCCEVLSEMFTEAQL
jgi:hypothetical protein